LTKNCQLQREVQSIEVMTNCFH